MQRVQPDGSTYRQQLEVVQRVTGEVPDELLNAPVLPSICNYVWDYFLRLNARRGSNGFGPSALSYSEIKAFCELEGIVLESWELELILLMDNVAITSIVEQQEKNSKHRESKSSNKKKR